TRSSTTAPGRYRTRLSAVSSQPPGMAFDARVGQVHGAGRTATAEAAYRQARPHRDLWSRCHDVAAPSLATRCRPQEHTQARRAMVQRKEQASPLSQSTSQEKSMSEDHSAADQSEVFAAAAVN